MPDITGTELRTVQPSRPGWGKKGYSTAEVDAFLARAADALDALAAGRTPQLTADEVHDVVFRNPPFGGGRGYDENHVDGLLDRIEHALRAGSGRPASDPVPLDGRPIDE